MAAWSRVRPTRAPGGDRAYDYACTCGAQSEEPVPTPPEADQQRQQHMRDEHS